ncbi:MAG: hypothetical protein LUG94_02635, partial [Ruminococcus sp.]|nr:hypothetical protein [Ruminococcus sp.]
YIVSNDNGYNSVIDFAREYLSVNIKKIKCIKEAFTSIKPQSLLEEFDSLNSDVMSIWQKRNIIENRLESNSVLSSNLVYSQFCQISAILVDDTKNTKEVATEYIIRAIGVKKANLVPSILECCKDFIR